MEAFQKTEVTPEMQANFARLIEDGEAKLVANKYQDALDDFRQVMPYQPNNPRLRAGMAWALVGLQRQPMADNVWRVAVSSDPGLGRRARRPAVQGRQQGERPRSLDQAPGERAGLRLALRACRRSSAVRPS